MGERARNKLTTVRLFGKTRSTVDVGGSVFTKHYVRGIGNSAFREIPDAFYGRLRWNRRQRDDRPGDNSRRL